MKMLSAVLITLPLSAGAASAQSESSFFLDASKLDIAACRPQNPNCDCKPATETCWFKTPDQQAVYFERDTMRIISRAEYEAE